jgi:gliding motility-associated-like protein
MYQRLLTSLLLFTVAELRAQVCTLPGQTPGTAFTICYNGSFFQSRLTPCRNNSFYVPGCTNQNTNYGDNNPIYYKFVCRTAGSFAFAITPVNSIDNYDWMLFDITGQDPNEIFTDRTLVISGNWSGSTGSTGASSIGVDFIQCRTLPQDGFKPTFNTMPFLKAGHEYLLMIGNMDDQGAGYSLSVGGGTADITSDANQEIKGSVTTCNKSEIILRFSKKIKCSSIAADGSDFIITPAVANINSVTGNNCGSRNETDSIVIGLTNPLPVGTYQVGFRKGTDGNSLVDQCSNILDGAMSIPFSILPFTAIDSIKAESCKPLKLILQLSKEIRCSTVAGNGSDFQITGPANVTISSAVVNCSSSVTKTIELNLLEPITTGGNYTVTILNGSDGNSLIDECNGATPAGTLFNLQLKDAVNANFTYTIRNGCVADTVTFTHPGGNEINNWYWNFNNNSNFSKEQSPEIIFSEGGNQSATLIVSNGFCSDTTQEFFSLPRKLVVDFTAPDTVCAGEQVLFVDRSRNTNSWLWDLGNGETSTIKNPPLQVYPAIDANQQYYITLTITDGVCTLSKTHTLIVDAVCSIILPNAFTPNSDGLNDYFGPLNTGAASDLQLLIYNRYGQLVFISQSNIVRWYGTMNGLKQPTGIYSWRLTYTDKRTGKALIKKGNVLLLR